MLKFFKNAYDGCRTGEQKLHVCFAAAQCGSLSLGEYGELLRFFSEHETK